jgi:hypothetical protein
MMRSVSKNEGIKAVEIPSVTPTMDLSGDNETNGLSDALSDEDEGYRELDFEH